jgi:pimeloyl-ACP methyl ester carboxylesterase
MRSRDPLNVETSHGIIAIEDTGPPGIPLVFLHGAVANLRAWDGVIAALGPAFRAIAVDLPAHGRTFVDPLEFSDLTAVLVEICDYLRLEDPIAIGHSFGGLAAVAAAGARPDHFSAAFAIDPYLSNRDVRGAHESVERALSAARDQPWPWDVVSDIDADIDRAVGTLYSPGRDPDVLKAILRRGYREQAGTTFLRYPRKEDNLEMLVVSLDLDVDEAYNAVTCPLAIAIATDIGPEAQRQTWVAQRRKTLESFETRSSHFESTEFQCGHDIVGFKPVELAEYTAEWVRRVCR